MSQLARWLQSLGQSHNHISSSVCKPHRGTSSDEKIMASPMSSIDEPDFYTDSKQTELETLILSPSEAEIFVDSKIYRGRPSKHCRWRLCFYVLLICVSTLIALFTFVHLKNGGGVSVPTLLSKLQGGL